VSNAEASAPVQFLETVWHWVFKPAEYATKQLYFNGPSKFGFWQGLSAPEICERLTRVGADLWNQNPRECETLISRDFHAFYITINSISLFLLFWRSIDIGLNAAISCCSRRPYPPSNLVYFQPHPSPSKTD